MDVHRLDPLDQGREGGRRDERDLVVGQGPAQQAQRRDGDEQVTQSEVAQDEGGGHV
jgi:hypothetical protein